MQIYNACRLWFKGIIIKKRYKYFRCYFFNVHLILTEKQLIILLLDLFLAGAETTTSTLGYALLYLIHYPDVQKKLQDEMDRVTGQDKQPTLQDRTR
uniref:Cytochrome P450 15A1 n=1 Tax=Triatoma infestans TaxID=30076 RepID=A0A170XCS6_TRIIF